MNQDGSLIGSAVRTALNQTAATGAGWTTLGYTPNTVVYNGNRSYTCTINGIDATGTLSPGMRIQATRTVTAPTQSTSLNGTTQYYSKTSPAGMTFTNNFVVSAWVKLSSYPASDSGVASRYDGSNGWWFGVNSSGQVILNGTSGAAGNYSRIVSYQSIPLNKWVHVTAQLDMSTFTATTTTSYIMIDGVDVPAQVFRTGTNPTSLVNAGTVNIGAINAVNFFPGKIAQVAIFSAKVTQATIQGYISQGLSGSETSLISAYSFNNTINDLNTTNANNLTANNGAVATNADTPFTQTNGLTGYTVGTTNFGIVTASSFSTNTTLVVQVPDGDTLPTTGGISGISYSTQKVPFAFPADRSNWIVLWLLKTDTYGIAGSGNWGTGATTLAFQISIPTGAWKVKYDLNHYADRGAGVNLDLLSSLSTNSAAETDSYWTTYAKEYSGGSSSYFAANHVREGSLTLSSQTIYYPIFKANSSDGILANHRITLNNYSPSLVTAECAYI